MREEKYYICELCGCSFDTKDLALECENRHQTFLDVMDYDFNKFELHPQRIKLKFDDGRCTWYRREE